MFYGERMSEIRFENDVKQKEIANVLGVSRVTYAIYEQQYSVIPLKYLVLFCNYFHVSMDYMFGFSKHMNMNEEIILDLKKIGIRLRKIRRENGCNQTETAKLLNINNTSLSGYEKGRHLISTTTLYIFCKTFHVSADYILGIQEDKNILENEKIKNFS